jgi:hypothetical protein
MSEIPIWSANNTNSNTKKAIAYTKINKMLLNHFKAVPVG